MESAWSRSSAAVAVVAVVLLLTWSKGRRYSRLGRALPGPKGIPFLGIAHELPPYHSWLKFAEWAKQYGPIYQISILGSNHVIVSTDKIANHLLRDRGAHYSSREQLPFAVKLVTNLRIAFLPYNDLWRRKRKLMTNFMKMTDLAEKVQLDESLKLIHGLLEFPADYEKKLNIYSSSIIMRLTYGKSVETGEEESFKSVLRCGHEFERYASPGAYLVDVFPVLLWLPKWLAPFKQEAERLRAEVTGLFRSFLSDATAAKKGENFSQAWLATQDQYQFTFDEAAFAMGQVFEAGAVTTSAAMHSYLLALLHHPEWQKRIQAEVDSVVPSTRLPDFSDMRKLPTVRAAVKESLRWRPVTPGNLPHKLTKDDVYEGFHIPKGTNVHAVQWAIHRDPDLYPHGDSFMPQRWLESTFPTYQEPLDQYPNLAGFSAFGYGRRICVGQPLAERSLYLFAARFAWACNIQHQFREDGSKIEPPLYDYTHGFSVQPNPFPFVLRARSEDRSKLIAREGGAAKQYS